MNLNELIEHLEELMDSGNGHRFVEDRDGNAIWPDQIKVETRDGHVVVAIDLARGNR